MKSNAKRRGCAYIRMSSSGQEASPEQQRAEVSSLADRNNVEIIAWLDRDLAITGDSGPELRPDFGRMLDMAKRCEFDVLLAFDQQRIGRFDSLDAGKWLGVLRDADIVILTCRDGQIDLGETFDRLRLAFQSETGNAENVSRAHSVCRGLGATARAGFATGGPAKYGLDRCEVTPDGTVVRTLAKGEQKSGRSNFISYISSKDKGKIAAIKYMFQRFAGSAISLRALAGELEDRGYPAPREGGKWHGPAVAGILANPCYAGHTRYSRRSVGKYYAIRSSGTEKRPRKAGRVVNDSPIIVDAQHAGIVTKRMFAKAAKRLAKMHVTRKANSRVGHPLTGLLRCSHCGAVLYLRRRAGLHFSCSSYAADGKRSGCNYNGVSAAQIEDLLGRIMCLEILSKAIPTLHKAITKELRAAARGGPQHVKRLRTAVQAADKEIDRLRRAIARTDDDGLVELLTTAKGRRAALQQELAQAGQFTTPGDVEVEVDRRMERLFQIPEVLASGDPAAVRGLYVDCLDRIECSWRQEQRDRTRIRSVLAGVQVVFKDDTLYDALYHCGGYSEA